MPCLDVNFNDNLMEREAFILSSKTWFYKKTNEYEYDLNVYKKKDVEKAMPFSRNVINTIFLCVFKISLLMFAV